MCRDDRVHLRASMARRLRRIRWPGGDWCSKAAEFAAVYEPSPRSKSLVTSRIRPWAKGGEHAAEVGRHGLQMQILSSRPEIGSGQRHFGETEASFFLVSRSRTQDRPRQLNRDDGGEPCRAGSQATP